MKINIEWNKDALNYVRGKLVEYNVQFLSEETKKATNADISILLKEKDNKILGGIIGQLKLNCLHIDLFWIDESVRGNGYGSKLLKAAEEAALEKGCRLVKVDTFSFQAPDFYVKQGFEIYGKIENHPEGYDQYYLYKKIKK